MALLQDGLEDLIIGRAYELATELISAKFAAEGVNLSRREREQLVEHLKSDAAETFEFRRWQWWQNTDLSIEITQEDTDDFDARYSEFLEKRLPELILPLTQEAASILLPTLHKDWPGRNRWEGRARRGFERRLHQQWGDTFGLLRMFVTISRELGEMILAELQDDTTLDRDCLLGVVIRLHARACQIAEEIVCLLEHGFADGAMARWRTLHEIAVICFFLGQHGDDMAKRYVEYEAVDSYGAAKCYRRHSARLGYEPMTDSEFDSICRQREKAVERYGKDFAEPFGWAISAFDDKGKKRLTFADIEKSVGVDHLRPHYKMASQNVHADPRSVFFRLGLAEESGLLLAGASDEGHADPCQCAALSLGQISAVLGTIKPTFDSLVIAVILQRLQAEICDALQNHLDDVHLGDKL